MFPVEGSRRTYRRFRFTGSRLPTISAIFASMQRQLAGHNSALQAQDAADDQIKDVIVDLRERVRAHLIGMDRDRHAVDLDAVDVRRLRDREAVGRVRRSGRARHSKAGGDQRHHKKNRDTSH